MYCIYICISDNPKMIYSYTKIGQYQKYYILKNKPEWALKQN